MAQQKMRFSDEELSLIKNTFTDREDLVQLIRKVFLQDKLEVEEIGKLAFISDSADLLMLFKKTFLPDLETDAPLHQLVDLWMSVDVKDKSIAESVVAMKVRCELRDLIALGIQRLEQPKEKGLKEIINYEPDFKKDDSEVYISLMARNALIAHTEFQIGQLYTLAGQNGETLDDLDKRLAKNSSK